MASNKVLIAAATAQLIQDGKIKPDEQINTFQFWKNAGFYVKPGEEHVAEVRIWKRKTSKIKYKDPDTGEEITQVSDDGRFYMTNACFFATHQVAKMPGA